ncbi:hypothetical protein V2J09_013285 [Rumex salicifolius]
MSFAAYTMMHWPTGIEACASGFITHSVADFPPLLPPVHSDDIDSDWPSPTPSARGLGSIPNLVVTSGNVLEIYAVRLHEAPASEAKRTAVISGVSGATLELVCYYRLHGNVESMQVLSIRADDNSRRRDSIILAFQDAKVSVLEYDDATHGLRLSSLHCFEGSEWLHLKRGKESFARGPLLKTDPQGRCCGALVYDLQMIILKTVQAGSGLAGDGEASNTDTPISPRIESSYIINLPELNMKHVKDFVFVHGYIEPVMVVLHERELTWAGRISWKHHTCMISAHSINTTMKQHPLIWSALNLPHDAYKLLAVPSPIGGVLVLCTNSIYYHSQSNSRALAVNNYMVPADNSQEVPRSNFDVELDAAHATWLANDVALLSTKNGELLLLTLVYDGRVVQRLDLSKSRASVLSSGIAAIGSSMFFLASRLGDSLLVQFTCGTVASNSSSLKEESQKIQAQHVSLTLFGQAGDVEDGAPFSKRLRRSSSDALQEIIVGEELSLYVSAPNKTESSQKSFSFAVRDTLINIGPLKDFAYSLRINANPSATGVAKQSNYELVSCSGHGKNGALCILQRSIRPEMITEVELPGCKGMWTVYHKSSRSHGSDALRPTVDDDEYHAYLIISLENRTMVLETADLLGEVTESVDYYVQGSTIAAGNLFGRRRVVQLYAHGARILDGSFMTQELSFGPSGSDAGSASESLAVCSVSIADPYVLLRMNDGTVQLLNGDPSSCTVTLSIPSVFDGSRKGISSCSLYHDKGPEPWLRKASADAWLTTGISEPLDGSDGTFNDLGDIYCIVCYENGTLEMFDLPNFNCVFSVEKFASGKAYLFDSFAKEPSHRTAKSSLETSGQGRKENVPNLKVVELTMQKWLGQQSCPSLFGILTDGSVLCYHAYLFEDQEHTKNEGPGSANDLTTLSGASASRLKNLRFVRVFLDFHTREEMPSGTAYPRLTMFKNVGGNQGFFLTGSRPTWFMIFRGRVRVHPQLCDGPIVAFTVLHNVNCNHGFIYVTSQGFLKICQLPSGLSFDNHWPVQKIPLNGTPHQVTYFAEKNLYPLIVSIPVIKPLNQILSTLADQEGGHQIDQDNLSPEELQQTYSIDEFEVRIMEPEKSGGPWQTKATIQMQTSENALTIRMNTTTKDNETLLAVGTAYVQGEDVAARGRVLLYALGRFDSSQNLVSEVSSKELKGAISALASIQGHLLIASGPKIILHTWTGTELNGVAFYDVPPLYVVSLNIVKNFILIGDAHKSIYFLSWKEQGSQLSLLAKDFGSLDCFATEFLIDGSTLSLVVSDEQKNVQILYYAPNKSESWKGQKLLSRAEFHVGAHVSKFLRLQMLPTSSDKTGGVHIQDKTNRFSLLFGTLDGSIGCIAPLDELSFRRLQSLQKKLVDSVPHVAGLNPRSFRQFKSNGKAHRPGPDTILDSELLYHYEMLPFEEQLEIAQQIGTTRSQILTNLNDLSLATSFL